MILLRVDMKTLSYMLATLLVFVLLGCGAPPELQQSGQKQVVEDKTELVILHDVSLSRSFEELAPSFEKSHPTIKVRLEGAAGMLVARKVSDVGRKADIVAVTDFRTIQRVLLPKLCEWYVCFALDEMVIAYTQQSNRREKMEKRNWFRVLTEKDVTMGLASPATDPCGYRTLMVFQLAELFYRSKIRGRAISEILQNPPRKPVIRPTTLALLPLLQTGTIDYLFTYRSVAEQHNLMYVRLKELLNLSAPRLVRYYGRVKVNIPPTETSKSARELRGEPIVYAFTVLKESKHLKEARLFADYLIGPKGAEVLAKSHQQVIRGGRIGFTSTGQPMLGE